MYKNILNNLYNRKIKGGQSSLECKFAEHYDTFDIDLKWNDTIDCSIGHFGYNFYFRTPQGLKAKRYKNIHTLANSIKKVAKKHNLTLVSVGLNRHYRYEPILTIQ